MAICIDFAGITVYVQEAALASAGRFPYRLQLQEERSQL